MKISKNFKDKGQKQERNESEIQSEGLEPMAQLSFAHTAQRLMGGYIHIHRASAFPLPLHPDTVQEQALYPPSKAV